MAYQHLLGIPNIHIFFISIRIFALINTIELYFWFNIKVCAKKKNIQLYLLNYLNHVESLLKLNNLLLSKEQLGNYLIYKIESNVITNRGTEVIQFRN